ncbi:dTDP-4-amino-4,6-dideoxygalactose transaminase [Chloroflexota bacterium]
MKKISFNQPIVVGNEYEYMQESVRNLHISGDGIFTKKCHALLEEILGVKKVLLTTNCTHALEMSAFLLNIQPGDEVILPSFTFVSTVNAFVLHGAKPVFIDIRPDTLNLDENLLESKITSKTKAIVPVHYAGVGCEMDEIMKIAEQNNIAVVEDNAHGLFGKYKGRFLGTFGKLATQSFHETKNFSCGEGGALLINNEDLIERAEIIREKGTNRSRFFRGQVDKYSWVDIGSSYLPSDLLAAWLFAQLENRTRIQDKRKKVWEFYYSSLQEWATENNIQLPIIPVSVEQSFHMFYLLLPSIEERQGLIEFLRERNIESVFHYLPLHLSEMGKRFGGKVGDCPVTERVSDQLVRLPFHNALSEDDQSLVVRSLLEFRT